MHCTWQSWFSLTLFYMGFWRYVNTWGGVSFWPPLKIDFFSKKCAIFWSGIKFGKILAIFWCLLQNFSTILTILIFGLWNIKRQFLDAPSHVIRSFHSLCEIELKKKNRFGVLLGHIMLSWINLKSYHNMTIDREWDEKNL